MTAESFWTQVGIYNQATLPVQIILILTAVFLTWRVITRPGEKTDLWMKAFFAVGFAWNAVVFFLIYVKNPISTYFGAPLFLILAVLFVLDIFKKRTGFRFPDAQWNRVIFILGVLVVLFYPLFGLPLGHTYPQMITPVMPCPFTVLAIVFMAASIPKIDRKILIFLLPWALAGLPKCLGALDCYEDCILFAAGVYGLIFLIKEWKAISKVQQAT